jgi:hypothetical protein
MLAEQSDAIRHPLQLHAIVQIVVIVMCLDDVEDGREDFNDRFLNDRAFSLRYPSC